MYIYEHVIRQQRSLASVSAGTPSCMCRHQCTGIIGLLQDHTVRLKERVITEPEVGEPMIARLIPEAQDTLWRLVNARYIKTSL